MIDYRNVDCMELLKTLENNSIDLAVVDPPYYKGPEKRKTYSSNLAKEKEYNVIEVWDVPTKEYFDELIRVSKHQIIWGCNHYDYNFGPGRIIWDKCNGDSDFGDCEIAYCSMIKTVRLFRFMWSGMFQGKSITEGHIQRGNKKLNQKRIHQNEKPIELYKWILITFAKKGWSILDTHGGSMSNGIACYDLGFDLLASEIDEKVYINSKKRLDIHMSQLRLEL